MTNPLSRLFLIIILSCLIALVSMLLMLQTNSSAQGGCPYIAKLSMAQWRPGATITVYFDQNYNWSDATKTAIKRAFLNWNAANGAYANNSGVTFVGFQSGPFPNIETVKDVFIVTKSPTASAPNGVLEQIS